MLRSRVDRLATEPDDLETLIEAVTVYHMVVEAMLALTGQHFIMDFNERMGTLPGFVQGFNLVARYEHGHVAFGARFLRDTARSDPRHVTAIQRTLAEVGPVADGVLRPPWMQGGDETAFLKTFQALLEHVREVGTPLDGDELEGSDVMLPPADTSFAEAQREFTGEGLIPD